MKTLPLLLALPLLAPFGTAHAADSIAGPTCRLVTDPTEVGADVEAFHVVGGPLVVANADVTSVTVTCWVTADGAPVATVSQTRDGVVGFVRGHATVGTFTGPVIGVCTQVTWTGGTGGGYDDCGTTA